jgi:hypothetical protein
MRQTAVFVFLILITFLPSCKFLRDKGFIGNKAKSLAVLVAKQDSIRVADSIRKVQDRLLALESVKLDSIKKADQERLDLETKFKYNIIVGSFITPEYARALSSEFDRLGYKTRILKLEGTRFEMVSAEARNNLRNAISRLKQFQDTVQIDAWIYIKR